MPLPLIVGVAVRVGIAAAGKIIAKRAATAAAKKAAELAAKKAAEQAAKKAATQGLGRQAGTSAIRDAAKKAAEASLKKSAPKSSAKGPGNTAGKHNAKKGSRRKGPCDHLKKGNPNGKGPYRGGSYGGTKKAGVDSHHAPANSVSPLRTSQGPAVQLLPSDHLLTSSHGQQGAAGARYRAQIGALLQQGKWREALKKEVADLRRVAKSVGDPKKYNQAIKEMMEYFKCLEMHNLLK